MVSMTPPAGPAEVPAAPAEASPIARIAAIAGVTRPLRRRSPRRLERTAAELSALTDAARARLAKVERRERADRLAMLTVEPVATDDELGLRLARRPDPPHIAATTAGTDFRAKPGTPVLAAGDGMVMFAGRQGGYGNVHLRRSRRRRGHALRAPAPDRDQEGRRGRGGRAHRPGRLDRPHDRPAPALRGPPRRPRRSIRSRR